MSDTPRKSKKQRRLEAQQKAKQNKMIKTGAAALAAIIVIILIVLYVRNINETADLEPGASNGSAMELMSGERPLANISPGERNNYYSSAPEMIIDPAYRYEAVFNMEKGGEMRVALFAQESPMTVNNFVFLANEGFYDGITFHRVLEGFMAQAGDPTGIGSGGPGYQFGDEVDNGLVFDRAGLLAMANAGPGTNGSQFFITFAATDWLNGGHTIFGEVIEGTEVLNAITMRNPSPDAPPGDAIERIDIYQSP